MGFNSGLKGLKASTRRCVQNSYTHSEPQLSDAAPERFRIPFLVVHSETLLLQSCCV